MTASAERDLSESLRDVYDELYARRRSGQTAEEMRAYAESLDGDLSEEEHEAVDRWLEAEATEPVRRRWRLPGIHDRLAADVVRELRR